MARLLPGFLWNNPAPAPCDVMTGSGCPSLSCLCLIVSVTFNGPADVILRRIPLRFPVYPVFVYFFLSSHWTGNFGSFFRNPCVSRSSFIFSISLRLMEDFRLRLAGSGATEEEHDRVPGGGQHSHPGCSGTDRRLHAQRRGGAGQLEEPRRQPLQWLLQLQHWSRTLWKGKHRAHDS